MLVWTPPPEVLDIETPNASPTFLASDNLSWRLLILFSKPEVLTLVKAEVNNFPKLSTFLSFNANWNKLKVC